MNTVRGTARIELRLEGLAKALNRTGSAGKRDRAGFDARLVRRGRESTGDATQDEVKRNESEAETRTMTGSNPHSALPPRPGTPSLVIIGHKPAIYLLPAPEIGASKY
jgi:hypothetical protein